MLHAILFYSISQIRKNTELSWYLFIQKRGFAHEFP